MGEHDGNPPKSPLSGKRILVVEDSGLTADEIIFGLEELGCKPIGPAATIEQGLEIVDRQSVDCALLDVNLAGEYVFPLAEALRERGIPFVLTTGYESSHLPDEYRDTPKLAKPFTDDELEAKLRTIL